MISGFITDGMTVTAPISPGSSGSPVVNDQGEVVGMVAAMRGKQYDAQNLNLCLPLEAIRQTLYYAAINLPQAVYNHERSSAQAAPTPAATPNVSRQRSASIGIARTIDAKTG
jgi:hypothetical protein